MRIEADRHQAFSVGQARPASGVQAFRARTAAGAAGSAPSVSRPMVDTATISPEARARAEAAAAEQALAPLAGHDLRNISYTDLMDVADGLRRTGALAESDYLDFIGPSPQYATISGDKNVAWNDPQDYVALHADRLAALEANGGEQQWIDTERRLLAMFRSFAAAGDA